MWICWIKEKINCFLMEDNIIILKREDNIILKTIEDLMFL
jgi:hypothetical protein